MLDPLNSLGLAANIVQLVQIGSQIVKTSYEAYNSIDGAPDDQVKLEEVTRSLYDLQDELVFRDAERPFKLSKDELALEGLAKHARDTAVKLLEILDDLKVSGDGLVRTWNSLRQAVRQSRKKSKISKIESSLDSIGTQVNTRLLQILRDQSSSSLKAVNALETSSARLKDDLEGQIRDMQQALLEEIRRQSQALSYMRIQDRVPPQTRSHALVPNALVASDGVVKQPNKQELTDPREARRAYYQTLHSLPVQIRDFSHNLDRIGRTHVVLESLSNKELTDRQFHIHAAHTRTFEWIFQDETTAFAEWLRSGNGVFWIRGKAGSGKSTLMKFLAFHDRRLELLQEWAGTERVVFASYFFWSSGSEIQRSQEGLLQSVLFQILRQCPDLTEVASPERWSAEWDPFSKQLHPWSRDELSAAFEQILAYGAISSRFCFFIDGLDEYAGDHYRLIKDFDRLSRIDRIKFCVSSRPWTPFKDQYDADTTRRLILEDLTKKDMERYIRDILVQDDRFARLAVLESAEAGSLISQISNKANGVFLWVFLVVKDLLRGLTFHDSYRELETRLAQIPEDLEKYFKKMLNSLDPTYRRYTLRALQLATFHAPLPLTAFWFLPEDVKDEKHVLTAKFPPLSSKDVQEYHDQAESCVNKWCRDLLEVSHSARCLRRDGSQWPLFEDEVVFLHRNVKDFLLAPEVQAVFLSESACQKSPRQAMCRIFLAQLKITNLYWSGFTLASTVLPAVHQILKWAKQCEIYESVSLAEILEELGHLLVRYIGPRDRSAALPGPHAHLGILPYAFRFDLLLFIQQSLDGMPPSQKSRIANDLLKSTWDSTWAFYRTEARPSPSMIETLLSRGANPNEHIAGRDYTVLQAYIEQGWMSDSLDGDIWTIVKAMVRYGGDVDTKIGGMRLVQGTGNSSLREFLAMRVPEEELQEVLKEQNGSKFAWRKLKRRLTGLR